MDSVYNKNSLHLKEFDDELYQLIEKEQYRQFSGLELVASENYTSQSVYDCLGKIIIVTI